MHHTICPPHFDPEVLHHAFGWLSAECIEDVPCDICASPTLETVWDLQADDLAEMGS